MNETSSILMAVRSFPAVLRTRHTTRVEAAMQTLNKCRCWREAIEQLRLEPSPDIELGNALLDFWFTYGKGSIPKGLRGDLFVVVDAFKHLWPPYTGPGLTLYRGEMYSRHRKGIYGLSWTPRIECAKTFVILQSEPTRLGVLLKLEATPVMIVAAVKDYSDHTLTLEEDEYLVDPRMVGGKVSVISSDLTS